MHTHFTLHMSTAEIIERLQEIENLVRERRYDLALALTGKLDDALAELPPGAQPLGEPVRDLLQASRLLTETLIRLQDLRLH
jgi:hypothetical protein